MVTLTLLKPLPCGVVIGPFSNTPVSRIKSQARGSIPELIPFSKTDCPRATVS